MVCWFAIGPAIGGREKSEGGRGRKREEEGGGNGVVSCDVNELNIDHVTC